MKTIDRTMPVTVRKAQADLANQLELLRKKVNPWAEVISAKVFTCREESLSATFFMSKDKLCTLYMWTREHYLSAPA